MRLICFWCVIVAVAHAQESEYYAPQTFKQVDPYGKQLFNPSDDVTPQGTTAQSWRPNAPPPVYENYRGTDSPRAEAWRLPYGGISKEQQAAILHHKQSLSSEGAFRFEYASDNGLAAGEVIEPDGSRVGAYQYKDPSGQLVKLKYRAGKEGFQILEGSHLPKSPEPVAPPAQNNYHTQAYEQQRRQYELQKEYNQQRPEPQNWQSQGPEPQRGAGSQYYTQNWRPDGRDDGQYRDNDIEEQSRGPHSFGEGYAFAFKG
ncbi:unnamed protein product, partial [Brenthis ino]